MRFFYITIWSFDQGRPDIIKQKIQEDFTRWWDWMKASFSHLHPQGWNLLRDDECGDNPTGPQVHCRFTKVSAAELFSFQLQSLFGALGGGLSLYLGCAVVMIFEVIELLVDLVLAFVCGKVLDKLRKPIFLNNFRRNMGKPDLWTEQKEQGANKLALYIWTWIGQRKQ